LSEAPISLHRSLDKTSDGRLFSITPVNSYMNGLICVCYRLNV
jgi:hypothetical protein